MAASSSMRRVPSTLIARESASPSSNETDAAPWTMSVATPANSSIELLSPSAGRSMSAGTATSRPS